MAAKKKTAKKTAAKKSTRAKPLAELFDEAVPNDAPTINRDPGSNVIVATRMDALLTADDVAQLQAQPTWGEGLQIAQSESDREIRFIFADVEKAKAFFNDAFSNANDMPQQLFVYKTSTETIWTDDEQTEVTTEAAINADE